MRVIFRQPVRQMCFKSIILSGGGKAEKMVNIAAVPSSTLAFWMEVSA
jgi:hypothetical protein